MERARVDFPDPVLPTTPTFSLGFIVKFNPRKTGFRSAAYLASKLTTSIAPWSGHLVHRKEKRVALEHKFRKKKKLRKDSLHQMQVVSL